MSWLIYNLELTADKPAQEQCDLITDCCDMTEKVLKVRLKSYTTVINVPNILGTQYLTIGGMTIA